MQTWWRFDSYQTKRLDHQRPRSHETTHDQATQHRLDLRYATVFGINSIMLYQDTGPYRKDSLGFVSNTSHFDTKRTKNSHRKEDKN